MKILKLAAFVAVLSGCDVVKDEAGYLGGHVERQADSHIFHARSQMQRADRYLMSLVIVAPVAAEFAETSAEAKAVSNHINEGYRILERMYAHAGRCLNMTSEEVATAKDEAKDASNKDKENVACVSISAPSNSAFSFENHSYEMQRTLYAIAKQGLDSAQLGKVANDIVELNLLGLLSAGRRAFPIARRVLATYRDTVITFGSAVSAACSNAEKEKGACKRLNRELTQMKTGKVAQTVFLSEHDNRMVRALLSSMDNAIKEGGGAETWKLQRYHVHGLLAHLDRACTSLTARQLSAINDLNIGEQADELAKIENCAGDYKLLSAIKPSRNRGKLIETVNKRP